MTNFLKTLAAALVLALIGLPVVLFAELPLYCSPVLGLGLLTLMRRN